VADRYDIGVRHGDQVAKDMIAVRLAPEMRMAIVGTPVTQLAVSSPGR